MKDKLLTLANQLDDVMSQAQFIANWTHDSKFNAQQLENELNILIAEIWDSQQQVKALQAGEPTSQAENNSLISMHKDQLAHFINLSVNSVKTLCDIADNMAGKGLFNLASQINEPCMVIFKVMDALAKLIPPQNATGEITA